MTLIKLIYRNLKKNIRDYVIYYSTLSISVALFYSFNSIHSQPALKSLDATKQLFSDQMGRLISVLSIVIAVVLAFLILYANQFLLKRRKKELGIYILLGMEKQKISTIFAGETLLIGIFSLVSGLALGFFLSQGLSLLALRLFAVDIEEFEIVLSSDALKTSILCFVIIFIIAMLLNVRTIAKVKLIDLLTAARKNEGLYFTNKKIQILLLGVSIIFIIISGLIIDRYGIMPNREDMWFQISVIFLAVGTVLFFYSISAVLLSVIQANKKIYLKGLNTFLTRQIGSKIRTNYVIMSVICGLLVVSICGISVGVSAAITMNDAAKAALPYDLNVLSEVDISGDTDIEEWLKSKNVDMKEIAAKTEQISIYETDFTYEQLFEGQDVELWDIDRVLPEEPVMIITVSDFNKAMSMQGKSKIQLKENEFLLNCNYKGTYKYVEEFLKSNNSITLAGRSIFAASSEVLQETYWMSSVGNNDRGTLIVSDYMANYLNKTENILLVSYKKSTNSDEVLQKMIPIGLEWETHGYRYTEKNMLNNMFYGSSAIWVFICSYVGIVFLLVCAALLSLKQLTETADNGYRYGLLQKLGASEKMINCTLLKQIGAFFILPLLVASIFSAFGIVKIMVVVEEFMNMHISTNLGGTIVIFALIYGGYFLVTYLSCKRIVQEKHIEKMGI